MIPKFIRFGIETTLKIFCEKITIKKINIVKKNDEKIDELHIKAESVSFNKINISKINIYVKNIIIKFALHKNPFFIENCNPVIYMRLTKDNINKTLLSKKWNRLKTSIESFIAESFETIDINNKLIYFLSSDGSLTSDIFCTLEYEKNTILLVNNINNQKLSILNDKNITFKNLFIRDRYIDLELSSKIIFN